jgi:hypothetical protein
VVLIFSSANALGIRTKKIQDSEEKYQARKNKPEQCEQTILNRQCQAEDQKRYPGQIDAVLLTPSLMTLTFLKVAYKNANMPGHHF